jgi:hypothetical protein
MLLLDTYNAREKNASIVYLGLVGMQYHKVHFCPAITIIIIIIIVHEH